MYSGNYFLIPHNMACIQLLCNTSKHYTECFLHCFLHTSVRQSINTQCSILWDKVKMAHNFKKHWVLWYLKQLVLTFFEIWKSPTSRIISKCRKLEYFPNLRHLFLTFPNYIWICPHESEFPWLCHQNLENFKIFHLEMPPKIRSVPRTRENSNFQILSKYHLSITTHCSSLCHSSTQ